jgi:hypothetical protein
MLYSNPDPDWEFAAQEIIDSSPDTSICEDD